MRGSDFDDLLKDKRVIDEINKHLWIESQKAGYSIGIEKATEDWLDQYAFRWMKYHMPEKYARIKNRLDAPREASAKK